MKQEWEPAQLEEMPVVILSLHQKWWQKMAAGEKVLELRKSKPQCKAPFRVLVYVTGGVGIVGEFICPEVLEIKNFEEAERKSKVPAHDIHNYAAGSRRKVYGWEVAAVAEYYTPHPLKLYGMERAPQSWCYYKGEPVPDIMPINTFANMCGYFYNACLNPENQRSANNGYNCRHTEQEERVDGVGECFQWSCPLACPADEEDCETYGIDYEENEFVLTNMR